MQTMYYKTSHFIQHSGNMVDLEEYRRRIEQVQRDSLARQPEVTGAVESEPQEGSPFRLVVLPVPQEDRPARRSRRAWTLDACASLSVIAMTLLFALRVML